MKTAFIFILFTAICSTTTLALNPSRTYQQKPEKYNMTYKEVKVKTNDGAAELNVWDFPSKSKTTKLILMIHNGEGNMGDYLRRIDQFRSEYNVVIFDYRGYGESSEFEIDNNMFIYPHFQDDVKTMIDYCRKQHTATFNLYGWGIGGGLALGIGYRRNEIKKIIADTPFLSMEDLEYRFEDWDAPMEVPFAGYDKMHEPQYTLNNTPGKNLQQVKLIIGSNDILFNKADMKNLQAKSKLVNKKVYVVENPNRRDNFSVDKSAYSKVILEFLKL